MRKLNITYKTECIDASQQAESHIPRLEPKPLSFSLVSRIMGLTTCAMHTPSQPESSVVGSELGRDDEVSRINTARTHFPYTTMLTERIVLRIHTVDQPDREVIIHCTQNEGFF